MVGMGMIGFCSILTSQCWIFILSDGGSSAVYSVAMTASDYNDATSASDPASPVDRGLDGQIGSMRSFWQG